METYAADGFDTLETCIREQLVDNQNTNSHVSKRHQESIERGLDLAYEQLQNNVAKHFGCFAARASHRCFAVPHDVVGVPEEVKRSNEQMDLLPPCSKTEEEALDAELSELRRKIATSRALAFRSKQELAHLTKELEMHGKVTERLRKVPDVALRENNENAYEGARMARHLVETAKRLQPLLHQAEKIAETGVFLNDERNERRSDAVQIASATMRSCFVKGGSLEALRAINAKLSSSVAANEVMTEDAMMTEH